MSAHSNIGPSSAERWIACPASVALSEQCPKGKTSIYAAEGTVAHGIAEPLLRGDIDEAELWTRLGETVECDGYEIEITEEMIEGAIFYKQIVDEDEAELVGDYRPSEIHREIEVRVYLRSVSDDLWGTADCLLYRKGHRLIVYDYKFGKGKAVTVEGNPQAALYALGALEKLGCPFDEVRLVIVQPRAPHTDGRVRSWIAPATWLKQFRADAHAAVIETKNPKAKLSAGAWCFWCPAQSICPEIHKETMRQTKADFSAVAPSETEIKAGVMPQLPAVPYLTIEELARALDWEDAIKAWFGAIRQRGQEILETGGEVPGYKLVEGRANRKWADETGAQIVDYFTAQGMVKFPLMTTPEPLSVAKMEKVVGKGKIPPEFIVKPAGALKIAPDSDPRPMSATSAQQDFDPLKVDLSNILPVADLEAAKGGVSRGIRAYIMEDPLALPEPARKAIWP